MLFSLYLGCQKFIHRDQGWAGGQNRSRAECDRRDEEGGGSCAVPRRARSSLESREPTEQDSGAETFQNSENLETHVKR